MKILFAGGTGFIGRALVPKLLEHGHEIFFLLRDPRRNPFAGLENLHPIEWDGENLGGWAQEVSRCQAVINLAGEPIGEKRWSEEQKLRIRDSRISSTRAIVRAVRESTQKPHVLVNASAVGFYGNVEEGLVNENAARGKGFLPDVCALWEKEALAAQNLGVRTVCLRTGIVLGKQSGALPRMLLPFKMFVGGPIGSGRQGFPWISLEDATGAALFALENPKLSGPVNLTAPDPVDMKQFCAALGRSLGRPSWLPLPAAVLRLMLGEMSALILQGQKVWPQKLEQAGYVFSHPKLEGALKSILA